MLKPEANKAKLRNLLIFFSTFVGIYLLFIVYRYVKVVIGDASYPSADFRFLRNDRFKDLFTINHAVADRNPYLSELSNYPPLILILAYLFTLVTGTTHSLDKISNHLERGLGISEVKIALVIFILIYVLAIFVITFIYGLKLAKRKQLFQSGKITLLISVITSGVLLMSAPSIFNIDRANYLAFTIIFMFLWAIFEKEEPDGVVGPIFAGLCAATKIYPIILLVPYLLEKKWKKLFVAILTGAITTIVPLFFFEGGFVANLIKFIRLAVGFGDGSFYSIYFTVGATGVFGFIFKIFGRLPSATLIKYLWAVSTVVFSVPTFIILAREKKIWRKLFVLSALMVFFTPNSYLYNSCYMLPSIFLMIMDDEEGHHNDRIYYFLAAFILVPKAFMYLTSYTGIVPHYYNYVNIGVFLDALAYISIITIYILSNYKLLSLDVVLGKRKADGLFDDYSPIISDEIKRAKAMKNIKKALYISAFVLVGAYIYNYLIYMSKDIISCRDTFEEYLSGFAYSFKDNYIRAIKFTLNRGRIGVIFPFLTTIRSYLMGHTGKFGNLLIQQLPIISTLGVIGFVLYRRTRIKAIGLFYVFISIALLQVNIWHSLANCYPFDFMYGLSLIIISVDLYTTYIQGEKGSKERKLARLLIAMLLYYEACQTYESFLAAGVIYFVVALGNAISKEKWIHKIRGRVIRDLWPMALTGVSFLALMFIFQKIHIFKDVIVINPMETGSAGGFIKALKVYSTGMFPLNYRGFVSGYLSTDSILTDKRVIFLTFICAAILLYIFYENISAIREKRNEIKRYLIITTISSALMVVLFPIPVSMTSHYQSWVDSGVGGYVPTTISYIFIMIALVCMFFFVLIYLDQKVSKKIMIATILLFSLCFSGAAHITREINDFFAGIESSSGRYVSECHLEIIDAVDYISDNELEIDVLYVEPIAHYNAIKKPLEDYVREKTGQNIIVEVDSEAIKALGDDISIYKISYDNSRNLTLAQVNSNLEFVDFIRYQFTDGVGYMIDISLIPVDGENIEEEENVA